MQLNLNILTEDENIRIHADSQKILRWVSWKISNARLMRRSENRVNHIIKR
jgi:hypothetical protein